MQEMFSIYTAAEKFENMQWPAIFACFQIFFSVRIKHKAGVYKFLCSKSVSGKL